MPRKYVPSSNEHYYLITARTNNREWFSIPMPVMWEIMQNELFFMVHAFGAEILQFLLMHNHFHLFAKFPFNNRAEALQRLLKESSRNYGEISGTENHLYGGRHHRAIVTSPVSLYHVYKYIYRNPVKAGIVGAVEGYPYSTLAGKLGFRRMIIPVIDELLFEDVEGMLKWLNEPTTKEIEQVIQKGIRKSEVSFSTDPSRRIITELDILPPFLTQQRHKKVCGTLPEECSGFGYLNDNLVVKAFV